MTRALYNAARTGLAEILAHKTRSTLSFLAIAAGSVVFIDAFSAIVATYARLESQKEVSGMARMKISQNNSRSVADVDDYQPPPVITYDDVLRLKERVPGLYMVSPEGTNWRNVLEYDGQRVLTRVAGITPEWRKRDFVYDLKGRFIDWHDVDQKLRVCVLVRPAPPEPSNAFFKTMRQKYNYMGGYDMLVTHNDLLGRVIKIDGINFTVIGVLDELPPSRKPPRIWWSGGDYKALAPVTTLMHYGVLRSHNSLDVSIDAGDEKGFDEAMRLVRNFLKVRFGDEDFFVVENQMDAIKESMSRNISSSLVTISLGMLAFIAGGIGIMNVTLATVFARTKEIGVRRAIGAGRGDIMLQFIVEAVMLGLIGGLLGTALGWFWGVPAKVMLGMPPSPIKVWMPLVSVFIAALTAFVFAIYPAWVAAGLKPAEALRAE
ncbi:MAG: FtsX-like permease family protein [Elusimicrobiales bacterium]|jgi:putative ABC transport system permease protein|nr:FtsX-like permease family protein [Elusimicrobiales bacterium]